MISSVEVVGFSDIGGRDEQQDCFSIRQAFGGDWYLGVFDGHGPEGAYMSHQGQRLVDRLVEISYDPSISPEPSRRLRLIQSLGQFMETVDPIVRYADGGSTVTVGLITKNEINIVWLGDSEAYFYPNDGDAIPLVVPHTPDNLAERQRVINISKYPHARVRNFEGIDYFSESVTNYIRISRSIGDHRHSFVSSEPDVTILGPDNLTSGTLVIATDGVWGTDLHSEVESVVRDVGLDQRAIRILGLKNQDNATAVVAKIEVIE